MATQSRIGQWVMRPDTWANQTLWHKVESEIEQDVITHCGRRMKRLNAAGKELEFHPTLPENGFCSRCS